MRIALTIAGSDPSGGAGVQADLKTFAAFGLYGISVITAVTAQSTSGVADSVALPADFVTAQIETVAADMAPHAVKVGMLSTASIVEAVAAAISELDLPLVVVDPVIASGSGERLLDADGVQMLIAELLPRARVITPNIPEAEALSGRRIRSTTDLRDAAARLADMGAEAVLITGGHQTAGDKVVDLLYEDGTLTEVVTPRVRVGPNVGRVHGTGCTHASAVAAGLAQGDSLFGAAERAQAYVAGAIRHAVAPGRGAALIDHFWEHRILKS